jgi:hypothetical protein
MDYVDLIKPSIGRIVWYTPSKQDLAEGFIDGREQPCAAIVCYVHDDHCVNLSVMDAHGRHFARQSIRLVQPGDTEWPADGYCQWMTYQIQAASNG